MHVTPPLDFRPETAAALREGRPVAALASAPIAHSLPWPDSLDATLRAIAAARAEGVVLAVVAVWQGRLTVGLTTEELEELALGASTLRASRRNLTTALVQRRTAATTVGASMYLARAAGIPVVASGAIGGAARGEQGDGHISADLVELSRTPVAVVTAGTRSVADLAWTAEILESYGVPVVGYRTDSLTAFLPSPRQSASFGPCRHPRRGRIPAGDPLGHERFGRGGGAADAGGHGAVSRRGAAGPPRRSAPGGRDGRSGKGPAADSHGAAQPLDGRPGMRVLQGDPGGQRPPGGAESPASLPTMERGASGRREPTDWRPISRLAPAARQRINAPCRRSRRAAPVAVEAVQHRHQVARQEQRRDHAADHDDGQRPLRLRADLRRQGGRQQAEDGRQGRSSSSAARACSAPCRIASRSGTPWARSG